MIYRVVIIDNGKQVSLTWKDGKLDLEGEANDWVRFIMNLAMERLMEVKGLDDTNDN